jgi:voltage-gated potassium channel
MVGERRVKRRGRWSSRTMAAARTGNVVPFLAGVTLVVALAGGILMRFLDQDTFPSIWDGVWFALQTVTTVGYGDVVPVDTWGKVVAAFVMVAGVTFIAFTTATVVSAFVSLEQRRSAAADAAADEAEREHILTAIERVERRLAAIESRLEP